MNLQQSAPYFPNNRFNNNNSMLNSNYSLSSSTLSSTAAVSSDMMGTNNQTMIMKSQNKENYYHCYSGIALQQQQVQQLQHQQQQQPQQQQISISQTKFTSLDTNLCSSTGGNSSSGCATNVASLSTNRAAGQIQAASIATSLASLTGAVAAAAATGTESGASQISATKLYERRQQQLSLGLQYLNCNSFGYGLLSEFYEPPKPDTPPSRNIPYWIDPIWSNEPIPTEKEPSTSSTELLNIPLPELKTYNKLPVILTPYVLSLAKSSSFSFDFDKSKQI